MAVEAHDDDDLRRPGTVTQEIDPLGHTSTAAYHAAGNLLSATERDNRLITYAYNALNRQVGETWIVGSTIVNRQTFSYDAAGN